MLWDHMAFSDIVDKDFENGFRLISQIGESTNQYRSISYNRIAMILAIAAISVSIIQFILPDYSPARRPTSPTAATVGSPTTGLSFESGLPHPFPSSDFCSESKTQQSTGSPAAPAAPIRPDENPGCSAQQH